MCACVKQKNGIFHESNLFIRSSTLFASYTRPASTSSSAFWSPLFRCRFIVHPIFLDNVRRNGTSKEGTSNDICSKVGVSIINKFNSCCKNTKKKNETPNKPSNYLTPIISSRKIISHASCLLLSHPTKSFLLLLTFSPLKHFSHLSPLSSHLSPLNLPQKLRQKLFTKILQ